MSWTQPSCGDCWIAEHGTFENDALVSYRNPVRVKNEGNKIEQCCKCGRFTFEGIFIRIDPATVVYPKEYPDD